MSDDVRELISEIDGLGDTESSGYLYSLLDRVRVALEASVLAPAVAREALANEVVNFVDGPTAVRITDHLIASGILQDAAKLEARGVRKAVQHYSDAQQVREGN